MHTWKEQHQEHYHAESHADRKSLKEFVKESLPKIEELLPDTEAIAAHWKLRDEQQGACKRDLTEPAEDTLYCHWDFEDCKNDSSE